MDQHNFLFLRYLMEEHVHSSELILAQSSLFWHKFGVFFLLCLMGCFGCALPFIQFYHFKCLNCFSYILYTKALACGTFIGLVLFHLLPETIQLSKQHQLGYYIKDHWYNGCWPLIFVGFICMMGFDRVCTFEVDYEIGNKNECETHHNDAPDSKTVNHLNCCKEDDNSIHASKVLCITHDEETVSIDQSASFRSLISNIKSEKKKLPFKHMEWLFYVPSLLPSLCISIHCIYEGFIVGAVQTSGNTWISALAVAGHKWAVGYALAVSYIDKQTKRSLLILALTLFIISSPLGVLLGSSVANQQSWIDACMSSLASGSLFYIGCELNFKKTQKSKDEQQCCLSNLCQFGMVLLGSTFVFGLTLLHLLDDTHTHH